MSFCCETRIRISHYSLPQHGPHSSTTCSYAKEINRIRCLRIVTEKKNCHYKPDSETVPGFQGSQGYKEPG